LNCHNCHKPTNTTPTASQLNPGPSSRPHLARILLTTPDITSRCQIAYFPLIARLLPADGLFTFYCILNFLTNKSHSKPLVKQAFLHLLIIAIVAKLRKIYYLPMPQKSHNTAVSDATKTNTRKSLTRTTYFPITAT